MSSYLPPEILIMIFSEVTKLSPQFRFQSQRLEQEDLDLKRFSLVCKDWTDIAVRKLSSNLVIKNRSHLMRILAHIRGNTLNGMHVKSLTIDFYRTRTSSERNTSKSYEEFKFETIKLEDFIQLVRLLPNLITLQLRSRFSLNFLKKDTQDLSIFSKLKNLQFSSGSEKSKGLQQLCMMAPQLQQLSILGCCQITPTTFSKCGQLRCLGIQNFQLEQTILIDFPTSIPLPSFRGMKKLCLSVNYIDDNLSIYLNLLTIAGPTLHTLTLGSNSAARNGIKYGSLIAIIKLLPVVQVLVAQCDVIGKDLFDHLPPTLHTLKGITISINHLQYLRNSSISRCSLSHLVLSCDSDMSQLLSLLPHSVINITLDLSQMESLLQQLELSNNFKSVYNLQLKEVVHRFTPSTQSINTIVAALKSFGLEFKHFPDTFSLHSFLD